MYPNEFRFESYDLKTEYMTSQINIPESKLELVRLAVGLDLQQWHLPGDLPLNVAQARAVAEILDLKIDGTEAYYFIGH